MAAAVALMIHERQLYRGMAFRKRPANVKAEASA
jgi:hypothetical protein